MWTHLQNGGRMRTKLLWAFLLLDNCCLNWMCRSQEVAHMGRDPICLTVMVRMLWCCFGKKILSQGLILAFKPRNFWTCGYGIYSTKVVLHDFGPLSFPIIFGYPSSSPLPPVKENIRDSFFFSHCISSEGTPFWLQLSTGWSCRWSARWPGPALLVGEVGF